MKKFQNFRQFDEKIGKKQLFSFPIITFFIPSSSVFVLLKFYFDMISSHWKLFHDP